MSLKIDCNLELTTKTYNLYTLRFSCSFTPQINLELNEDTAFLYKVFRRRTLDIPFSGD